MEILHMLISAPNSSCPFAGTPQGAKPGAEQTDSSNSKGAPKKELTQDEKDRVKELKKTDQEVRSHEMAHVAAGGGVVRGGPKFEYQNGPDGRQYAVAGEVSIDTSPVSGDPQATIIKMQKVQSAALAPANPSGQDRQVASQAAAVAAKARMELAKQAFSAANEGQETGAKSSIKKIYDRNGQVQNADLVDKGSQGLDIYS